MKTESTDVLIVGSGPIGATFARFLSELAPQARILMVEAGPQLTTPPGVNVKNLPEEERSPAERKSQGPASAETGGLRMPMQIEGTITARAGTHLVDEGGGRPGPQGEMPAAAMSTCVGGMGAHWTCATPRPLGTERIPFIPDAEWEQAIVAAERLLGTTTLPPHPGLDSTLRRLTSELFDPFLPPDRKVGGVPIAATIAAPDRIVWTGVDKILGPLAEQPLDGVAGQLELRANTLCRELLADTGHIRGARLEDLSSGTEYEVGAAAVVVAADSFRTPQLLHASGIQPSALGRHLNEHPMIFSIVVLDEALIGRARPTQASEVESIARASRVPAIDDERPFSVYVFNVDRSPVPLPEDFDDGAATYAVVGAGGRRKPRWEDRVELSDSARDARGMPKMSIHYGPSQSERAEMEAAKAELERAARFLGEFFPGGEPRELPAGSSLHYQGTIRMGPDDDGASVCDSYSRVWGFDNLFLGGNGLIPTATVSNPTLTSVAIAIRACDRIVRVLRPTTASL